jgi:cobalamin biosynthesis Mg chelatase CobN
MFSISQDEMLAGLEHMEEHKQTYYDAHCPNCRRANRVERLRMERSFPDWKKAIQVMAKEAAGVAAVKPAAEKSAAGAKPAPAKKSAAKPAAKAASKKAIPAAAKKTASKPKPKTGGTKKK